MENNGYYDINFTPLVGCFYINTMISEFGFESVPFYKIFIIFPLLFDYDFLSYTLKKRRTNEFYKLINSFVNEKEESLFWIEYNMKFLSNRKYCFDSIYFGLMIGAFELTENGLKNTRVLFNEIPIEMSGFLNSIKKLGKSIRDIKVFELLRIMKMGEKIC